jgi:hypothetical protein
MKFKKLLAKKKTVISWVVILELFNHGQREFNFKNKWQKKTTRIAY